MAVLSLSRPQIRPRASSTLSLYMMSELVFPTVYSIVGFALVVLTTDMLGYAELIVNRGLSLGTVGWMALFQLVPTVARTIPFAVLVGCLVGLGRLGADRELLALEASGLSARQLARPCLIFATLAMGFGMAVSVSGAPASQRALVRLLTETAEERPGAALQSGVATKIGDWRIEAAEVSETGRRLERVLVFMPSIGETIFARHGALIEEESKPTTFVLEQGLVLKNGTKRASVLRFDRMETEVRPKVVKEDLPTSFPTSTAFSDLLAIAARGSDAPEHADKRPEVVMRQAEIEVHGRLAMGLAALPFGLLAVSISVGRRSLSRSAGGVVAIPVVVAYYALVQLADGMLRNPERTAWIVWLPNAVLITASLVLLARAGRRASASDRQSAFSLFRQRAEGAVSAARIRVKNFALPRYVGSQFLQMAAICLAALVFAYLVIDVFDNLKWFNKYNATGEDILRFYAARLPVLTGRVVSIALLIACSLTISLIASRGELLGMRACGIPVLRVVAPVILLCGVAVPLDHVLANFVVPRANEQASRIKREDIKGQARPTDEVHTSTWYRVDDRVYEAKELDLLRGRANGVKVYELGEEGLPVSRVDAVRARHIGSGSWFLSKPRRVEIVDGGLATSVPEPFAELGEEVPAEVDTANLTPDDLREQITIVEAGGRPATEFRVALHSRLATPLACLVMPLIALFFAATGPPFPRPVHTLVLAAMLAVLQALAISLTSSFGRNGTLSPLVAGWLPTVLFTVVAVYMGLRLRSKVQHVS